MTSSHDSHLPKDITERTGRSKKGFDRIRFCGEQARHDGWQYFSVDTCCIDKSNAAELQEAINSMFRWYQNAVKCYVYLSDVSTKKLKWHNSFTQYTWKPAFQSIWPLKNTLRHRKWFWATEACWLGLGLFLRIMQHYLIGMVACSLQGTLLCQMADYDFWCQCIKYTAYIYLEYIFVADITLL